MESLTTGQVAKQAQVNIETVRYYERRGLIPEPPRRESGYRQYPRDMVARIQFIKRAQELGFSLKEIAELLSLRLAPNTPAIVIREKAEAKVAEPVRRVVVVTILRTAVPGIVAPAATTADPVRATRRSTRISH